MTTSPHSVLTLSVACALALAGIAPVCAATPAALTVYRSDSSALYASSGDGSVGDGYAVVREQRTLKLAAGTHDVILGDLSKPPYAARIQFEKVFTNPTDQSVLKREQWTASVTYVFRSKVRNEELAVNPLGLTIIHFHTDQAFE